MRSTSTILALLVLAAGFLSLPGCKSRATVDDGPADTPTAVMPAPSPSDSGADADDVGAEPFGRGDITGGDEVEEVDPFDAGRVMLQPIYFSFDSSALSDVALRTLQKNADSLRAAPNVRVVIEGHCDERGTTEYNLELGARRARAVREHLSRLGIAADRLETISYGEERPVDEGHSESAWAKNRRAEFRAESM